MKLGVVDFIRNQRKAIPPPETVRPLVQDYSCYPARITGIGYEAAKYFAKMKPGKLIIACRSKERGDAAVAQLKEETGFENVFLRLLDLAKFSSVIEFADKFEQEEDRLDIVVATPPSVGPTMSLQKDGWESGLQINISRRCCSTSGLLPIMIKTGQRFSVEPRLVVVGSGMHYFTKFEKRVEETLNDKGILASLFMTRPLAKILEKTPVVANVVDPGFCNSDFRKELERQLLKKVLMTVMETLLGRTSEAGACQYVWAALAENTNGRMRGAYVDTLAVQETSDYSLSKEGLAVEQKLWDNFVKVLGEVDPKVPSILKDCSSYGI
ncbi:short-chain dehydrogenase [Coprinopsis sp. MPI-PUGE-AT-0042]|nr:short-chain dehydrogenase [Coprinopsis sp. MPI-PUGE-AT-0042]